MKLLEISFRWGGLAIVFLLTLELAARVDDALTWGAPLVGRYSHGTLTMRDSLGVRNRPDYRFEKWRINNLGFRGSDVAQVPPDSVLRIGVLGASETFGLFESEGWEYPALLQLELDSIQAGRFQVLNAAVAGMGLPAMRRYFEKVVAPASPALVIIYPSPSFYLDLEPPTPPMEEEPALSSETPRAGPGFPGLSDFRIVAKGRTVLRDFIPRGIQSRVREQRLEAFRDGLGSAMLWDEVPEDRMVQFGQDLRALVRSVQASGAKPVLVTHANRFQRSLDALSAEDQHHLLAINSLYPRATPQVLREVDEAANEVIRGLARENGWSVIEASGRIPADAEHFADYAHFTDQGAARMADLLAAGVVSLLQGVTPERTDSGVAEGADPPAATGGLN